MTKVIACTACETVSAAAFKMPGSGFFEFFLYLIFIWPGVLFIWPGVLFSVWRRTNKKPCCKFCGSTNVVPPETNAGRRIVEAHRATQVSKFKIVDEKGIA